MNLTSVDPPEVIRFVKQHYPDVELIKPKMSIYDMRRRKAVFLLRKSDGAVRNLRKCLGPARLR
jgi:phosphoadenosine phosphosulfate reductase